MLDRIRKTALASSVLATLALSFPLQAAEGPPGPSRPGKCAVAGPVGSPGSDGSALPALAVAVVTLLRVRSRRDAPTPRRSA